jgi:hypothetical protein
MNGLRVGCAVIHGLNSTLLQELEERTDERTWNENSAIGDIFVRMVRCSLLDH